MSRIVPKKLTPDILRMLEESEIQDIAHLSTESLMMVCATHAVPENYHETKKERIKKRMRTGEPYTAEPFPEKPRVNQEEMSSHFSGKYTQGSYNYGFSLYDEQGRLGSGYCLDAGNGGSLFLLGKEGRGLGHALLFVFGEPHDHQKHLEEISSYLARTQPSVTFLTEHLVDLEGPDKEVGVAYETSGGRPCLYRLYSTGSKQDFFRTLRFEDPRLPYDGGINERQVLSMLLHRSRHAEAHSYDDEDVEELKKINEHLASALEGFKNIRKRGEEQRLQMKEDLYEQHAQFMEKRLRREIEVEDKKSV